METEAKEALRHFLRKSVSFNLVSYVNFLYMLSISSCFLVFYAGKKKFFDQNNAVFMNP